MISKAALLLLWRFWPEPFLVTIIVDLDPLSAWLSQSVISVFFDKGIANSNSALVFEALLCLVFAGECALAAFFAQRGWMFAKHAFKDAFPKSSI